MLKQIESIFTENVRNLFEEKIIRHIQRRLNNFTGFEELNLF